MAVPRSVLPYPAEKINTTLDTIEGRLPAIPRRMLQINRAVASLGCSLATRAASALGDSSEVVADAAATGTRTVTGQARSVLDRTMSTAASGTREIAGQARAQTEHFVDTVEHEAMELADEAETVADDMTEASFASWTRADLYERAQELDIEGRSGMNKAQLIDALMHETDPEG
ncbi:MAG: Rho termination factor N-terminal domain-containing protein [Acidimicrobiales bacterium]